MTYVKFKQGPIENQEGMAALGPGIRTFILRLRSVAKKMSVQVINMTEEYISKIIRWSGEIIQGLGGAKAIKSKHSQTMDRKYNGAGNICIKFLSANLV